MASYVKFRRGNPQAFQAILDANKAELDTLYFIYEEDESVGELYLGSKLIAGGGDVIGATTLRALSDVLLDNELNENDCLIYDINKQRWVNKPIADILPVFVGTNGSSSSVAGLVPATTGTNPNLFLRSDGKWSEIVVASEALVLQTIVGANETHEAAINRIVGENKLNKGDIVVLKDIIAEDHYQHTSYAYNGEAWVAMDGNYNAENVYFDEDFIFTEALGTVIIPESGNVIVPAAGKNLKEFFANLFAAEQNPTVTKPSATLNLQSAEKVEVGTTYTPNYVIVFNKGSYTYGPDTGISATYLVTDTNGGVNNSASGKFDSFVVNDETDYKINAVVNYSEGTVPVSNLGNPVEEEKIVADVINLETAIAVKGYRNAFYGTLTEKGELTSDVIRSLNKTNADVEAGTSLFVNIPVGTKRVVIAYEATLRNLTSVLDKNDANANIVSGFGAPQTIKVEGANGYDAIDYQVYVMDFANPYDTANVFTATI